LREPSGIALAGVPADLHRIKTPVCFLSAYEDHIAPWKSARIIGVVDPDYF
jgi:polyhydroxyalkanoate synthase